MRAVGYTILRWETLIREFYQAPLLKVFPTTGFVRSAAWERTISLRPEILRIAAEGTCLHESNEETSVHGLQFLSMVFG